MKEVINTAKRVSKERGYTMYLIFDCEDNSYAFTQEKNIILYDRQSIIGEVDYDDVIIY
jgi:hypothetical protein